MSSQNQEELKRKVEEVKQDADVQHALQQATPTERTGVRLVRASDIVWIATQLFFLIILGALYTFLKYRLPQFAYAPLLKLLLAIGVVIVCVTALRLVDVYLIGRVRNAVYQYNLKRVSRLVLWLVIAFFVLTIFFQNWYTAVVSFGLISLILGFALQTPITSFIGWIYILVREPYRVGDRIKIGTATGDVIDVNYLDTTLWEFGGDFLSTEHPSGRIIKFPNSTVLSQPVYNYTWPLFPYIWN